MNFRQLLTYLSLTAVATADVPKPAFPCCPVDGEGHNPRPDAHAPISVMGDHTHAKGGVMMSYHYMRMEMGGMRNGTERVSSTEVFAADGGYTVTPDNMAMDMHMLGLMYAPTDKLTLMLMANYVEIEMDHQINPMAPTMLLDAASGDTFTTESSGWGDIKLTALYRFYLEDNRKAHVGIGLSLPTGSIDKQDSTPPTFDANQLPAPMQLGSGTFDLLPSLTYVQQFEVWSWGVQANGTLRLEDENNNGYRLGHVFETLGWAGYNLSDSISLSGGFSYKHAGELRGTQNDVGKSGPMGLNSVTTAFSQNYGGERIDAILGINLLGKNGLPRGHRIAADIRVPIWQDLNGYQLETDWTFTVGWQKSF